jgi:hypothetical protein
MIVELGHRQVCPVGVRDHSGHPGLVPADGEPVRWRDVGRRVRRGQHPALGDQRPAAVAAEEADDGPPFGIVDEALGIDAIVADDHRSPEPTPSALHP